MPHKAFITNTQTKTLKKRLSELIEHSAELKFLAGFFYFSGWGEIYDSLKDRTDIEIKVLVGLDVDKKLFSMLEFSQPDGSDTKDKTTTKTLKVAGCTVTLVDIPGTYKDMPGGPFAGGQAVDRPDYRMLAAIVETPGRGSYFLKFYGPGATVAKHADGFRTMVEGLVAAAK